MASTGLRDSSQLRTVARSHVIARRKDLEARALSPASIRSKLSALSPLFDYLCERNAVIGNPVDGVKRPATNNNEGSTPALGDAQARRLLEAPPPDTLSPATSSISSAKPLWMSRRLPAASGLIRAHGKLPHRFQNDHRFPVANLPTPVAS